MQVTNVLQELRHSESIYFTAIFVFAAAWAIPAVFVHISRQQVPSNFLESRRGLTQCFLSVGVLLVQQHFGLTVLPLLNNDFVNKCRVVLLARLLFCLRHLLANIRNSLSSLLLLFFHVEKISLNTPQLVF
jgi:hypothetical protein